MKPIKLHNLSYFHEVGHDMINAEIMSCEDHDGDYVYNFLDAYRAYVDNPKNMTLFRTAYETFLPVARLIKNDRIKIVLQGEK